VALAPVPRQDPTPDTGPVTSTSDPVADTEVPAADVTEAEEQASADLRSVWVIVAALVAVALGLLVLLVLYVRATNPRRAAARREERLARVRDSAREMTGDDGESKVGDAAAAKAASAGTADADDTGDETADGADGADATVAADGAAPAGGAAGAGPTPGAVAPAAAVLSRPPVGGDEGVRVLAGEAADDAVGVGCRALPVTASGEEVEVPEGAEAPVRIVPAPDPDRLPPRELLERPTPPTRRRRRVEAPPKTLVTPDAERVLVRPGRRPVRVPPAPASTPEPSTAPDVGASGSPASPSTGPDADPASPGPGETAATDPGPRPRPATDAEAPGGEGSGR